MRTPRTWEMLVIVAMVAVVGLLALPAAMAAHRSARASCANNLKQLGLVIKMYSSEDRRGGFPPVSRTPGNWMLDATVLMPDFLTDIALLECPGSPVPRGGFGLSTRGPDPACVSGRFYNYTGFAISSDEQAVALWTARHALPPERFHGRDFALPRPKWANSDGYAAVSQSGLPILWDRVRPDESLIAHCARGINVLHADGHVAFVPYSYLNNSSFFPATRMAGITIGADDAELPSQCL